MITVRIEHPISSFDTWKAAFDRDPVDRAGSGVTHYTVTRPLDDDAFVMIDLDFAGTEQAAAFVDRMRQVWSSAQAAPALRGAPQVRIVRQVEDRELVGDPQIGPPDSRP